MRCPWCTALDDKVVDSRASEEGAATRRRRECLSCGRRFTTYERVEELLLVVIKRNGERQPFDRAKLVRGLEAAAKNRPVDQAGIEAIAADVEETARMDGPEVTSEWIGRSVLDRLRAVDEVAYLRFASVHKGFEDAEDFEREMGELAKDDPEGSSRGPETRAAGMGSPPHSDEGLPEEPVTESGS